MVFGYTHGVSVAQTVMYVDGALTHRLGVISRASDRRKWSSVARIFIQWHYGGRRISVSKLIARKTVTDYVGIA